MIPGHSVVVDSGVQIHPPTNPESMSFNVSLESEKERAFGRFVTAVSIAWTIAVVGAGFLLIALGGTLF